MPIEEDIPTTEDLKQVFCENMKNAGKQTFNVYVIELDPEILNKDADFRERNPNQEGGKECLYVGMTSKTPEERFEIHKAGGEHASKKVTLYGLYLRRNLYRKYNPLMTQEIAYLVEDWLAKKLQKEGYGVWWN